MIALKNKDPRKCLYCGKEFIPYTGLSKYCSVSCNKKDYHRKKYQAHPVEEKTIECACCGKAFVPNPGTSNRIKYCSDDCRREIDRRHKKETYIPAPKPQEYTCIYCGKVFVPKLNHRGVIACSGECNYKYHNSIGKKERARRRQELIEQGKDCIICGKHFIPKSPLNVLCSDKCRKKHIKNNRQKYINSKSKDTKRNWYFKKRLQGNYKKVIERDNRTCQFCGSTEKTEVHHLNGMGEKGLRGESRKELPCDHSLENLITLCRLCHRAMHNNMLVKHKGKWYIKGSLFEQLGITGSIEIWTGK